MRILVHLNHYFGPSPGFRGKSVVQASDVRRAIVERALEAVRSLPGEVTVRVCGVPGRALVPLDVAFEALEDPRLLVYASLARMAEDVRGYDYFINLEDDVLLPGRTFEQVLAFDAEALPNECLHPNRIEVRDGLRRCVDLEALPGWTTQERRFQGRVCRVAVNPHSGLLILSQEKLRYALGRVDLGFRGTVVGGPMASAYANFHRPFSLYRVYEDVDFHVVEHLDHWIPDSGARFEAQLPVTPGIERPFTAVLLSWRRPKNLPALVESLCRIPHIQEILVWNNNPDVALHLPGATVFQAPRNFHCLARYCLVPLARFDNIWFQDDDVRIRPDQFEALLSQYRDADGRIYGCRGRNIQHGTYIYQDVYGDVDVVLGQTMMFHRRLLREAFAALGELPPPTVEDDIAFSLSVGGKHRAVDVEPLEDLGMSDDVALWRAPGHGALRQAAVERYTAHFRTRAAEAAQRQDMLAAAEERASRAEHALAALAEAHRGLAGSAGVRLLDRAKRLPGVYRGYLALKRRRAR